MRLPGTYLSPASSPCADACIWALRISKETEVECDGSRSFSLLHCGLTARILTLSAYLDGGSRLCTRKLPMAFLSTPTSDSKSPSRLRTSKMDWCSLWIPRSSDTECCARLLVSFTALLGWPALMLASRRSVLWDSERVMQRAYHHVSYLEYAFKVYRCDTTAPLRNDDSLTRCRAVA
jgi:hypothetical protein